MQHFWRNVLGSLLSMSKITVRCQAAKHLVFLCTETTRQRSSQATAQYITNNCTKIITWQASMCREKYLRGLRIRPVFDFSAWQLPSYVTSQSFVNGVADTGLVSGHCLHFAGPATITEWNPLQRSPNRLLCSDRGRIYLCCLYNTPDKMDVLSSLAQDG